MWSKTKRFRKHDTYRLRETLSLSLSFFLFQTLLSLSAVVVVVAFSGAVCLCGVLTFGLVWSKTERLRKHDTYRLATNCHPVYGAGRSRLGQMKWYTSVTNFLIKSRTYIPIRKDRRRGFCRSMK